MAVIPISQRRTVTAIGCWDQEKQSYIVCMFGDGANMPEYEFVIKSKAKAYDADKLDKIEAFIADNADEIAELYRKKKEDKLKELFSKIKL